MDSKEYVTMDTLNNTVLHLETKIENSNLRNRNWILTGVIAIGVMFFAGYANLVTKLDSITVTTQIIEERRTWLLRNDERDRKQDEILHQIDKTYVPMPYMDPPR